MLTHIYADGRLGSIQPIDGQPGKFKPSASYVYGVGGFLLAGSELDRLARRSPDGASLTRAEQDPPKQSWRIGILRMTSGTFESGSSRRHTSIYSGLRSASPANSKTRPPRREIVEVLHVLGEWPLRFVRDVRKHECDRVRDTVAVRPFELPEIVVPG